MRFDMSKLNGMYLDVLREIGNIGSGHAATALSKMIDKPVRMEVPNIEVLPTEKVVELFEDPEEPTIGTYINFSGQQNGTILTIMDKPSGDALCALLLGEKPKDFYSEMQRSVFHELGNIMASSYVNSISSISSLDIQISVPSVNVDMISSILSVPAVEYGLESDKLLLIENSLRIENENIRYYFFFMPDLESFDKLFRALGVALNE